MVKHTQTIRWQVAGELFECFGPFCGVGALTINILFKRLYEESFEDLQIVIENFKPVSLCRFRLVSLRSYIVTFITTLNKFHKQTNNVS